MYALLSILQVDVLASVFAQGTDLFIAAGADTTSLAENIRNWIGPLLLLGIGIVSLSFLVQRQMTQFFQFFAIALVVAALFYAPGFVKTLGTMLSGWIG